jgi:hypothetical protein
MVVMKPYTKHSLEEKYHCTVTDNRQGYGPNVYRTIKPEPGYPGLEFSFIYSDDTGEAFDVDGPGFGHYEQLGIDMESSYYEDIIQSLLDGHYKYRMIKLLFITLIEIVIRTRHNGEIIVQCRIRDVKKLYKQNKLNVGAYERRQS